MLRNENGDGLRHRETSPVAVIELLECAVHRPQFTLGPIDIAVAPGQMFCVVGPNGAGKTTLLELMAGLLTPTVGSVEICGEPVDPRRRTHITRIGYVPDDAASVLDELSAKEYWRLIANVHSRATGRDARHILAHADRFATELSFNPPDRTIGTYSHGMRKKTQLIGALALEPALLIVDEPANGLDPLALRRVERILKDEALRGAAVICATHDLPWAERVADGIIIVSDGTFLATGRVSSILEGSEESLEDAFFRLIGNST